MLLVHRVEHEAQLSKGVDLVVETSTQDFFDIFKRTYYGKTEQNLSNPN